MVNVLLGPRNFPDVQKKRPLKEVIDVPDISSDRKDKVKPLDNDDIPEKVQVYSGDTSTSDTKKIEDKGVETIFEKNVEKDALD